MLLCYITDRKQLSSDHDQSLRLVLDRISAATRAGVDVIQIREKDVTARVLVELGTQAVRIVREGNAANTSKPRTRLLINSRLDVAVACGADGVHLPADDISASDARFVLSKAGIYRALIGASCHTIREIELAEGHGADFAMYGPVFEKAGRGVPSGIEQLKLVCCRSAVKPQMPVIGIGGVTLDNALRCLQAGARGIAAIRLFQSGDIVEKVSRLRRLAA